MTTFDPLGPLPTGTTVLEASAGTGKTWTIAALVTRYVAEGGVRLPDLLVVTFTRAATAELRERVRTRLVGAADHLQAVTDGASPEVDDDLLAHLAAADVEPRLARLRQAVRDVDAATIATIHGFCQVVLDGLGLVSDLDRNAELVDDHGDLLEQAVDDLSVRTFSDSGDRPIVARDRLLDLGRLAVGNPAAPLRPDRAEERSETAVRLHLAQRLREEVAQRARRVRALSYDDLLTTLDAALQDARRGSDARDDLRRRYRVVLIDEFQDTDPVQWRILRTAFHDDAAAPERALVLIGDPKQSIYAFRGGDVHSYLDAVAHTSDVHTLDRSWRADGPLLEAFDALFTGAAFGDDAIRYQPVRHAPGRGSSRLVGTPDPAPLRLRLLRRTPGVRTWKGKIVADVARDLIGRDVALDIARVLSAGTRLVDGRGERPLVPGDIAVLVRTNDQAARIQQELREVAVPAVINGVDSVLQTAAATDWQRLLDALERPTATTRVRALAASSWLGWDAERLATAAERDWDDVHTRVHAWSRLLVERGVAALHREVATAAATYPRLLRRADGRRYVADLEHVGELLHAAATGEHLGPAALADWLRVHVAEASRADAEERLRRLESDADAVQVLTVHRSKGLEFPLVYCPFLWSGGGQDPWKGSAFVFHEADRTRTLDVGGDHDANEDHRQRAVADQHAEDLRLVYVALTRAAQQVVIWFAPAGRPDWAGLNRLLLHRDDQGRLATLDRPVTLPADDEPIARTCHRWAARADGLVHVADVPTEQPAHVTWRPPTPHTGDLSAAVFGRALDEAWRRTSYSALTVHDPEPQVAAGRDGQVASEPDDALLDDEADVSLDRPAPAPVDAPDVPPVGAPPLPLADVPGGAEVGTLVHAILEHTDLAAADLGAELRQVTAEQMRRWRLDLDADDLVAGLAAAIRTPMGPLVDDRPLRTVTRADRLDELAFELPLDAAGGTRSPRVGDLLAGFRDHLPTHDPLRDYADHVPATVKRRDLRGFLTGSIDLVLRHRGDDGDTRFVVIDHKTNVTAPRGEPLRAHHYHPDALVDAMVHGHYPLQALLYQSALHRYLRWRLPGYVPATHLGGALYLFLRGMAGPETPRADGQPYGVFAWAPPPSLIVATSDLLHGRVAA